MILAVHQPQYIPWLGYFHKMAHCDLFIFLDDVQYKKREFQNRNKIKTAHGAQWLTVPVVTKGHYTQNISEVRIDPTHPEWGKQHFKAIELNYGKAPYFAEHKAFFEECYGATWQKLQDVSLEIIRYVCNYLEITTSTKMSSEYALESMSTQRIIDLCKAVGADTYFSGSGGRAYMEEDAFSRENIMLTFQEYVHPTYAQLHGDFVPYMSIIDLLCNEGPQSRTLVRG